PRRPDFFRQKLDVGRQISRAALLATFDDHHDARVWCLLLLHRPHGRDRCEDRVSIVRATAPVELPVAPDRRPRSEAGFPPFEGWLFVAVTVHENRLGPVSVDLD